MQVSVGCLVVCELHSSRGVYGGTAEFNCDGARNGFLQSGAQKVGKLSRVALRFYGGNAVVSDDRALEKRKLYIHAASPRDRKLFCRCELLQQNAAGNADLRIYRTDLLADLRHLARKSVVHPFVLADDDLYADRYGARALREEKEQECGFGRFALTYDLEVTLPRLFPRFPRPMARTTKKLGLSHLDSPLTKMTSMNPHLRKLELF